MSKLKQRLHTPRGTAAADIARLAHGLGLLPEIEVVDYNATLRDGDGFLGDRASKRAFRSIIERERERLRSTGPDPLGPRATADMSKKALDAVLLRGKVEAAGVMIGAIEDFAHALATVTQHLLQTPGWRGVRVIAVGGGMRASRCGELAIGRASVLLKASGQDVALRPIWHHPDEAGLIGSVQLVPAATLAGFDGFLAVDIGGSNMRAGIVELNLKQAPDLSRARVMSLDIWRHCDDRPTREAATQRLCAMLHDLSRRARKNGVRLAPFVGVGCPGIVAADGTIEQGGQNLPGDWEGPGFNLPASIREALPKIGGQPVAVMMHNDAVIQGLSEVPRMRDVGSWGVLTIGTGLGNASYTNRKPSRSST